MHLPMRTARLLTVAALALAGACGTDGGTASVRPTDTPAASASAPLARSEPPSVTSTPATSSPPADRPDLAAVSIRLEVVVGDLRQPLFVTDAGDGSGRLFVVEQGGRIRVVRDGRLDPEPFLDLAERVSSGGERGLLGLAFPPGFGTERLTFFVHYTDTAGDTTISEFRVPTAGAAADPRSERVILREAQPYANHNGGWIGFAPDGMLLVGLGDGGSGGDPQNRASRLDTILGKVLRLHVLDPPGGGPYAIPGDNPFVGRAGARGEILHLGLRNPWRASIDPATGDLWIGDVGQNTWEEVDVAPAGARGLDFGWNRLEARECFRPSTGCDTAGVTLPVTEYPHGLGCSVVGGVVYRGPAMPALRGGYLFADYCSGTVWAIDAGFDGRQAPLVLLESGRSISSFGVDAGGAVYLTDLSSGEVLRLVPGP